MEGPTRQRVGAASGEDGGGCVRLGSPVMSVGRRTKLVQRRRRPPSPAASLSSLLSGFESQMKSSVCLDTEALSRHLASTRTLPGSRAIRQAGHLPSISPSLPLCMPPSLLPGRPSVALVTADLLRNALHYSTVAHPVVRQSGCTPFPLCPSVRPSLPFSVRPSARPSLSVRPFV